MFNLCALWLPSLIYYLCLFECFGPKNTSTHLRHHNRITISISVGGFGWCWERRVVSMVNASHNDFIVVLLNVFLIWQRLIANYTDIFQNNTNYFFIDIKSRACDYIIVYDIVDGGWTPPLLFQLSTLFQMCDKYGFTHTKWDCWSSAKYSLTGFKPQIALHQGFSQSITLKNISSQCTLKNLL